MPVNFGKMIQDPLTALTVVHPCWNIKYQRNKHEICGSEPIKCHHHASLENGEHKTCFFRDR